MAVSSILQVISVVDVVRTKQSYPSTWTGLSYGSSEKLVPVIVKTCPPRLDPEFADNPVTLDSVVISRGLVSSLPIVSWVS